MTIRYDRPVSLAAQFSRRLGLFALLLFLIVLGAHRFSLMPTPYFVALVLLAAAVAALSVVLALIGLVRLWQVAAKGGGAAFKALFLSLPPLLLVAWGAYDYMRYPPLYDISTDVADPPAWLQAPRADQSWMKRRLTVSDTDRVTQLAAYPGVTGRRYNGALDRIFEAVEKVNVQQRIAILRGDGVENTQPDIADIPLKPSEEEAVPDNLDNVPVPLPRPNLSSDQPLIGRSGDVLLQGETRTLLIGFRFDVLIRLREEAETTLVDVRVVSRYGPHDLGYGAAIADRYLKALDAELLGLVPN